MYSSAERLPGISDLTKQHQWLNPRS